MSLLTKAEVLALLADNDSGDISPEDVREIVHLSQGIYGGLSNNHSGIIMQQFNDTPTQVRQWNNALPSIGIVPEVSGATSGTLTIQVSGTYELRGMFSFNGNNNITYHLHVFSDGAELDPHIGFTRKVGTNNDVGSAGFCGLVELPSGSVLSVYADADDGANLRDLNIEEGSFVAKKVG